MITLRNSEDTKHKTKKLIYHIIHPYLIFPFADHCPLCPSKTISHRSPHEVPIFATARVGTLPRGCSERLKPSLSLGGKALRLLEDSAKNYFFKAPKMRKKNTFVLLLKPIDAYSSFKKPHFVEFSGILDTLRLSEGLYLDPQGAA